MDCKLCFGTKKRLYGGKLVKCPCVDTKKEKDDELIFQACLRRLGKEISAFRSGNQKRKASQYRLDLSRSIQELQKSVGMVRRVINAGRKPIYRSPYDKG